MTPLTHRLEAALAAEETVAQATRLTGEPLGAKLLLFPDGTQLGTLGDSELDAAVAAEATRGMAKARGQLAQALEVVGTRVFLEIFLPPPHLLLFGGVHVAVPLAHFAKILGFRVTLVDPRTTFANAQRFPEVDRIIPAWPQEAMQAFTISPATYVAILTHDPKLDEPALEAVLGRGAAYIGAIGSRRTQRERFARMAQRGVLAEALREVHAPIGLDLGAETPEEIALAILAEIVAVRRGGGGGFLRDG